MTWQQLFLGAMLIESLTQTAKWLYKEGLQLDRLIAFGIAVVVMPLIGLDLFTTVGLPIILPYNIGYYVGAILTGVIAARGANVFHDLMKYLEQRVAA